MGGNNDSVNAEILLFHILSVVRGMRWRKGGRNISIWQSSPPRVTRRKRGKGGEKEDSLRQEFKGGAKRGPPFIDSPGYEGWGKKRASY